MNWIKRFLGLNDQQQKNRTQEVKEYVAEKKGSFNKNIKELHRQAKKVHAQASRTTEESAKLVLMVADVTTKIAVASGSIKLKGKKRGII